MFLFRNIFRPPFRNYRYPSAFRERPYRDHPIVANTGEGHFKITPYEPTPPSRAVHDTIFDLSTYWICAIVIGISGALGVASYSHLHSALHKRQKEAEEINREEFTKMLLFKDINARRDFENKAAALNKRENIHVKRPWASTLTYYDKDSRPRGPPWQ